MAQGKFLGIYDIIDTDAEPIRIEGADILFPPRKDYRGRSFINKIHFGSSGPPEDVPLLFGYDVAFGTPEEFLKAFPGTKPWPEPGPRIADYCKRSSAAPTSDSIPRARSQPAAFAGAGGGRPDSRLSADGQECLES